MSRPYPVIERCAVCHWPTTFQTDRTPVICGDCLAVARGDADPRILVVHPTREEIQSRVHALLSREPQP